MQEALGADGLTVLLVERGAGDRTLAAVAHKVLRMPGFAKRSQRLFQDRGRYIYIYG